MGIAPGKGWKSFCYQTYMKHPLVTSRHTSIAAEGKACVFVSWHCAGVQRRCRPPYRPGVAAYQCGACVQEMTAFLAKMWRKALGAAPCAAHVALRRLAVRGVVLRHYTMNVDGLSLLAGELPFRLPQRPTWASQRWEEESTSQADARYADTATSSLLFHRRGKGVHKPYKYAHGHYCRICLRPHFIVFPQSRVSRASSQSKLLWRCILPQGRGGGGRGLHTWGRDAEAERRGLR